MTRTLHIRCRIPSYVRHVNAQTAEYIAVLIFHSSVDLNYRETSFAAHVRCNTVGAFSAEYTMLHYRTLLLTDSVSSGKTKCEAK